MGEELVLTTRLLEFHHVEPIKTYLLLSGIFLKFSGHPKGLKVGESWRKLKKKNAGFVGILQPQNFIGH